MENKLIGKRIIKAEIIKPYDTTYYSKEEMKDWDDKPILRLEMEDGSVFEIIAYYGGYTGKSQDEYPSLIKIIKKEIDTPRLTNKGLKFIRKELK